MEDAHCVKLGLLDNIDFFGVYDGHGGSCVAKFVASTLHMTFKDYIVEGIEPEQALPKAFLRVDELMRTEAGIEQLRKFIEDDKKKEDKKKEDDPTPGEDGPRSKDDSDIEGDKKDKESQSPDGERSFMNILKDMVKQAKNQVGNEGLNAVTPAMDTGCTSVVCVKVDDKLVCANAGDSRCVLSRKGKAVPLSFDHKPSQKVEIDRIKNAGGYISMGRVNGNLNLSRALGDLQYKQDPNIPAEAQIITGNPDIKVETITDEDEFLIIACDGIWDVLSSQAAVSYVREKLAAKMPLKTLVEEMLDDCLGESPSRSELGCDNMTLVIARLRDDLVEDA